MSKARKDIIKHCQHCQRFIADCDKLKIATPKLNVLLDAFESESRSAIEYEAITIMLLRVVEFMRTFACDADSIVSEFLNGIGEYEIELAKCENIDIHEINAG